MSPALPGPDAHHQQLLRDLFGDMSDEAVREIFAIGTRVEIAPGDILIEQGSDVHPLYIVLAGRLRVLSTQDGVTTILGDVREGEPLGEFSLFSGEPQIGSAVALRRCDLLRFSREDYLRLIVTQPQLAMSLPRFVMQRMTMNLFERRREKAAKNIVLLTLQDDLDLRPWADGVSQFFAESGSPARFYVQAYHQSDPARLFATIDSHEGTNVFVCSPAEREWTRLCVASSDLVVLVSDASATPDLTDIERDLRLYDTTILNRRIYLALVHPEHTLRPTGTQRWLAPRRVALHLHVRRSHERDMRRFCRIVTNRAVGLVLGGGGAKGYAHIGAARALRERGVEIDFVGGTSAGAIYGLLMAYLDFDLDAVETRCAAAVESSLTSSGYTLPLVSVMNGERLRGFIRHTFGETRLEDLWITAYCVSTDYTGATPSVHDRGVLWRRVLASIAIPGVFPPVVLDGRLHIDGGVMDNVPVEPMHRYPVGMVLAIALSGSAQQSVSFEDTPSSWSLLWQRLRGAAPPDVPGIGTLLVNSITLNSKQRQEAIRERVSHYLELDLQDVGMLEDRRWRDTLRRGYEQGGAYWDALPPAARG